MSGEDIRLGDLVRQATTVLGDRQWLISKCRDDSQATALSIRSATFAQTLFTISEGDKGDGDRWSPFTFSGERRQAHEATRADFMVFDIDLGYRLEDLETTLDILQWAALIAPSPSYGKTESAECAEWRFRAWQQDRALIGTAGIQDFMQADNWMLPWLAKSITGVGTKTLTEPHLTPKGETP